jgi:hypothetical protein
VIEHFRFPLTIFHPPPETKFLTGPAAVCIAKMSGNTHFVFIDMKINMEQEQPEFCPLI